MEKFDSALEELKEKFPDLKEGLLGCYLCNFDDQYICREYNGGCKGISICEMIKENEVIK